MLTNVVLALTLTAVPGAALAAPHTADALDTELLESKLDAFADLADHSVLVEVRSGDETWSEAAGPRSLDEDARDAQPGDRVRIGSASKSMVAVILLQLQGEGAVDLDDPIGDYLPGLLPYEEDPTIREILQHRSGVPDFLPRLYPSLAEGSLDDVRDGYRNHYEPEELVAIGTQGPLLFDPGEGWSYSNTGYMALGLLIEELTGNGYGHELTERIIEPAGLERTYFPRGDTSGIRGPHSVPYVTTGEPEDPYFDATELSNSQLWAPGGVMSTVGDVNDFYEAVTDGTLLTADQLAEATEYVDTGRSYQYGLGLEARKLGCPDDPNEVFLGHTGDGLGHQTYSFHSYDGERQITLSWNLDDKHGYVDPDTFDQAVDELVEAGLCGAPS